MSFVDYQSFHKITKYEDICKEDKEMSLEDLTEQHKLWEEHIGNKLRPKECETCSNRPNCELFNFFNWANNFWRFEQGKFICENMNLNGEIHE